MSDDLTDDDREYARRWAAARGITLSQHVRTKWWEFDKEQKLSWPWGVGLLLGHVYDCTATESDAWEALAVVLRDLRRAVEIPAKP